MQHIIYIYSREWTTPILQIFDALNIGMSVRASDISTATFTVPLYTAQGTIHTALSDIRYLAKRNRVIITKFSNNEEIVQYEGYISGTEDIETSCQVTCSDMVALLEARSIPQDLTYTQKSIASILTDVLGIINGISQTGLTLDNNLPAELVSRKFSAGQYALSIFQDLTKWGYSFIIRDRKIYFGKNIWKDRSTGGNFREFRYDWRDGIWRNIANFRFFSDVKNIRNAVFTKNSAGVLYSAIDAWSISEYGRLDETITIETNDNVQSELQKYLTEHKYDTIELEVTPSAQDFTLVDIWDTVKVYIDRWDARAKYDGTMTVTAKDYTESGITFSLSSTKIKTQNILEHILKLDREIQKIKSL